MISGFYKIKMKKSDIYKSAYRIHLLERFKFRVQPFRLIYLPSVFQRILTKLLQELFGKNSATFI